MIPTLRGITSWQELSPTSQDYDALIYIYHDSAHLANLPGMGAILRQASVDQSLYEGVHLLAADDIPAGRLVRATSHLSGSPMLTLH